MNRIEEKLAGSLPAGGHRGIGGVAAWMGWPDDPAYKEREKKYLECEVNSMGEALDEIQTSGEEGIILDTTAASCTRARKSAAGCSASPPWCTSKPLPRKRRS